MTADNYPSSSFAAFTTSSTLICNIPASVWSLRLWLVTLVASRNTRDRVPYGPLRAGSVGPKMPTTGRSNAAARCSGPVSPATTTVARRTNEISCPSVHGTARA